jgi:hypothetical protein
MILIIGTIAALILWAIGSIIISTILGTTLIADA